MSRSILRKDRRDTSYWCLGAKPEGVKLEEAIKLRPKEAIKLDTDRLTELFVRLGPKGAEETICRAMEDLAVLLTDIEGAYWQSDFIAVENAARIVIDVAQKIGLMSLANVALSVVQTIETADATAVSSTVARLGRVGDNSLTAVWDVRDLSV